MLDWSREIDENVEGEEVMDLHYEGTLPYFISSKACQLAPGFSPTPFAAAADGYVDVMLMKVQVRISYFFLFSLRHDHVPMISVYINRKGQRGWNFLKHSKVLGQVTDRTANCRLWTMSSVRHTRYSLHYKKNR